MRITGKELIAARALTGLSQRDFARLAGINPDTMNRLEQSGAGYVRAREPTVDKILACLGQHGIALAPGDIIHAPNENPGAVMEKQHQGSTAAVPSTSVANARQYLR